MTAFMWWFCRSIVAVLGVGFVPSNGGSGDLAEESIFMVTELCNGGCMRKKILDQMLRPRKVRALPLLPSCLLVQYRTLILGLATEIAVWAACIMFHGDCAGAALSCQQRCAGVHGFLRT